jgi:hypothetical protein
MTTYILEVERSGGGSAQWYVRGWVTENGLPVLIPGLRTCDTPESVSDGLLSSLDDTHQCQDGLQDGDTIESRRTRVRQGDGSWLVIPPLRFVVKGVHIVKAEALKAPRSKGKSYSTHPYAKPPRKGLRKAVWDALESGEITTRDEARAMAAAAEALPRVGVNYFWGWETWKTAQGGLHDCDRCGQTVGQDTLSHDEASGEAICETCYSAQVEAARKAEEAKILPFAAQLKTWRLGAGYSQGGLAKALTAAGGKITRGTLSNLETGRIALPSVAVLEALKTLGFGS